MIIRGIEQGSPEWFEIRRGIPTASEFGKILTATTLKPSATAPIYRYELIAEWLGVSEDSYQSDWMERGHEIEDEARAWYRFESDADIEQVAFVYGDDRKLYGCSPDGLLGEYGGVEIKCPKASTHVEYLLGKNEVPSKYRAQVYGSLMVTGREWWDFVSYYPGLDPFVVRMTNKDKNYLKWIEAFTPELEVFIQTMLDERTKLSGKEIPA